MSISVTVDTKDAHVLSLVGRLFTELARREAGLEPLGCGCKEQGHSTALGPITQHCLELAKEQNAAQQFDISPFKGAALHAAMERGEDLSAVFPPLPEQPIVDAADALAVSGTTMELYNELATAPSYLPPMDDPRVVPELSGSYTSPTGMLAGSAPAAPQLDKNGLPWDARVNTSNKAMTQTGVWKMRKGLPEGEYDKVVAELRAAQGAVVVPAPPAADRGVVLPPTSQNPVPTTPTAAPVPPVTPAAAPVPPAAAPVPPAADAPTTFADLVPHVTRAINSGKIDLETVNAMVSSMTNGAITKLPMLATRQDLIPEVFKQLSAAWSL